LVGCGRSKPRPLADERSNRSPALVSKCKKDFSSVAKNLLEDIGPLPVSVLKISTRIEWIED
jgi:hypothetical protein